MLGWWEVWLEIWEPGWLEMLGSEASLLAVKPAFEQTSEPGLEPDLEPGLEPDLKLALEHTFEPAFEQPLISSL